MFDKCNTKHNINISTPQALPVFYKHKKPHPNKYTLQKILIYSYLNNPFHFRKLTSSLITKTQCDKYSHPPFANVTNQIGDRITNHIIQTVNLAQTSFPYIIMIAVVPAYYPRCIPSLSFINCFVNTRRKSERFIETYVYKNVSK